MGELTEKVLVISWIEADKMCLTCINLIDTVLVLSKLKNERNRTATATQRFKVFCDI